MKAKKQSKIDFTFQLSIRNVRPSESTIMRKTNNKRYAIAETDEGKRIKIYAGDKVRFHLYVTDHQGRTIDCGLDYWSVDRVWDGEAFHTATYNGPSGEPDDVLEKEISIPLECIISGHIKAKRPQPVFGFMKKHYLLLALVVLAAFQGWVVGLLSQAYHIPAVTTLCLSALMGFMLGFIFTLMDMLNSAYASFDREVKTACDSIDRIMEGLKK